MRRFVLEHSDFTRLQSNVTKHVNIMTELSEAVARRGLMDMSMAEQEVANPAASLTSAASYDEVMRLLRQPGTSFKDKVALVMLYALRFQADGLRVSALRDYLAAAAGGGSADPSLGEAQRLLGAVGAVLGYAGADKRAGDLYGQRSLLGKARNLVKGLQGVDNVYTQHTPLLAETLAQLGKDNLAVGAYPYIAATQDEALGYQAMFKKAPPREVIVFVIGGTTYEEEKAVAEVNAAGGVRVLLGGTGILNSQQFMDALTCAQ